MPHLFEAPQLRELVLPNRIGMSPMCQYSAQDGRAGDWRFVAAQLAHAGRKGSIGLGREAQRSLSKAEGGWPTIAPSAVSFGEGCTMPLCEDVGNTRFRSP